MKGLIVFKNYLKPICVHRVRNNLDFFTKVKDQIEDFAARKISMAYFRFKLRQFEFEKLNKDLAEKQGKARKKSP